MGLCAGDVASVGKRLDHFIQTDVPVTLGKVSADVDNDLVVVGLLTLEGVTFQFFLIDGTDRCQLFGIRQALLVDRRGKGTPLAG